MSRLEKTRNLKEKKGKMSNFKQNKKNINFRKWGTFHKLYKTESFSYYMLNFIIMNLPILGRPLFNIRYGILKILGKR